jgi:hypothetical protein
MFTYIATKKVGAKRIGLAGLTFITHSTCLAIARDMFDKLGIYSNEVYWGDVAKNKNYTQSPDFIVVDRYKAEEVLSVVRAEHVARTRELLMNWGMVC